MASIRFLGAAQEVTGSCHLLSSAAVGKVLLDCGMHQGGDAVDRLQEERFAFKPAEIDAVILSHAHIDHSGLLPKLVSEGFRGPIYCTRATADLLEVMLNDAAGLYERDLERENLRRARRGAPDLPPAYTRDDVERVFKQCSPQRYHQPCAIGEAGSVTFHDAGHILGSAIVELTLQEQGREKRLVFSGDLGKKDSVLLFDPEVLTRADLVMMEGTYGDRDHRTLGNTLEQFEQVLHEAWERGGNVMIPAFAVGRTQELLFYLGQLHEQGKLDNWQVFLDSPMAIEVTRLYDRWLSQLDCEGVKGLCSGDQTLLRDFLPRLQLTPSTDESMMINKIKRGALIIAGSGMCTGGRIRHHFKQRIWDERNTIVFVGFQARNTLGRILIDGVQRIKLFREEYLVRAQIETLGGFSAHAGQTGLVEWVSHFENNPKVVLVHGEPEALDALAKRLWDEHQIEAMIPTPGQCLAF